LNVGTEVVGEKLGYEELGALVGSEELGRTDDGNSELGYTLVG
jgi:hypothetical protein